MSAASARLQQWKWRYLGNRRSFILQFLCSIAAMCWVLLYSHRNDDLQTPVTNEGCSVDFPKVFIKGFSAEIAAAHAILLLLMLLQRFSGVEGADAAKDEHFVSRSGILTFFATDTVLFCIILLSSLISVLVLVSDFKCSVECVSKWDADLSTHANSASLLAVDLEAEFDKRNKFRNNSSAVLLCAVLQAVALLASLIHVGCGEFLSYAVGALLVAVWVWAVNASAVVHVVAVLMVVFLAVCTRLQHTELRNKHQLYLKITADATGDMTGSGATSPQPKKQGGGRIGVVGIVDTAAAAAVASSDPSGGGLPDKMRGNKGSGAVVSANSQNRAREDGEVQLGDLIVVLLSVEARLRVLRHSVLEWDQMWSNGGDSNPRLRAMRRQLQSHTSMPASHTEALMLQLNAETVLNCVNFYASLSQCIRLVLQANCESLAAMVDQGQGEGNGLGHGEGGRGGGSHGRRAYARGLDQGVGVGVGGLTNRTPNNSDFFVRFSRQGGDYAAVIAAVLADIEGITEHATASGGMFSQQDVAYLHLPTQRPQFVVSSNTRTTLQFSKVCLRVFAMVESIYGGALPLFVEDDPATDVSITLSNVPIFELVLFLMVLAGLENEKFFSTGLPGVTSSGGAGAAAGGAEAAGATSTAKEEGEVAGAGVKSPDGDASTGGKNPQSRPHDESTTGSANAAKVGGGVGVGIGGSGVGLKGIYFMKCEQYIPGSSAGNGLGGLAGLGLGIGAQRMKRRQKQQEMGVAEVLLSNHWRITFQRSNFEAHSPSMHLPTTPGRSFAKVVGINSNTSPAPGSNSKSRGAEASTIPKSNNNSNSESNNNSNSESSGSETEGKKRKEADKIASKTVEKQSSSDKNDTKSKRHAEAKGSDSDSATTFARAKPRRRTKPDHDRRVSFNSKTKTSKGPPTSNVMHRMANLLRQRFFPQLSVISHLQQQQQQQHFSTLATGGGGGSGIWHGSGTGSGIGAASAVENNKSGVGIYVSGWVMHLVSGGDSGMELVQGRVLEETTDYYFHKRAGVGGLLRRKGVGKAGSGPKDVRKESDSSDQSQSRRSGGSGGSGSENSEKHSVGTTSGSGGRNRHGRRASSGGLTEGSAGGAAGGDVSPTNSARKVHSSSSRRQHYDLDRKRSDSESGSGGDQVIGSGSKSSSHHRRHSGRSSGGIVSGSGGTNGNGSARRQASSPAELPREVDETVAAVASTSRIMGNRKRTTSTTSTNSGGGSSGGNGGGGGSSSRGKNNTTTPIAKPVDIYSLLPIHRQCWLNVESHLGDPLRMLSVRDKIRLYGVPIASCSMHNLHKSRFRYPVVLVYEGMLMKYREQLGKDLSKVASVVVVLCDHSPLTVDEIESHRELRIAACLTADAPLLEINSCIHRATQYAETRSAVASSELLAKLAMEDQLAEAAQVPGEGAGTGSHVGNGPRTGVANYGAVRSPHHRSSSGHGGRGSGQRSRAGTVDELDPGSVERMAKSIPEEPSSRSSRKEASATRNGGALPRPKHWSFDHRLAVRRTVEDAQSTWLAYIGRVESVVRSCSVEYEDRRFVLATLLEGRMRISRARVDMLDCLDTVSLDSVEKMLVGSDEAAAAEASISTSASGAECVSSTNTIPVTSSARAVQELIQDDNARRMKYVVDAYIPAIEALRGHLTDKNKDLLTLGGAVEKLAARSAVDGFRHVSCWATTMYEVVGLVVLHETCMQTAKNAAALAPKSGTKGDEGGAGGGGGSRSRRQLRYKFKFHSTEYTITDNGRWHRSVTKRMKKVKEGEDEALEAHEELDRMLLARQNQQALAAAAAASRAARGRGETPRSFDSNNTDDRDGAGGGSNKSTSEGLKAGLMLQVAAPVVESSGGDEEKEDVEAKDDVEGVGDLDVDLVLIDAKFVHLIGEMLSTLENTIWAIALEDRT